MKERTIFNLCLAILLAYAGIMGSCNKRLDIESTAAVAGKNMWRTFDDARSGLVAMYGLTRAALADNNAAWLYGEFRNGDFVSTMPGDYLDAVINNELYKGHSEIRSASNWRRFYAAIDACNTFIRNSGGCRADPRYHELYYKVDVAQAHMLRAFNYFYMARIWGDVPLITKPIDLSSTEGISRTPQFKVLEFCINELKTYSDSLPTQYGGGDKSRLAFNETYYDRTSGDLGNTFWGMFQAYEILGQLYAWRGEYANAVIYLKKIFDRQADAHVALITSPNVATYLSGPTSIFYGQGVKGTTYFQLVSLPYDLANRESGPSGIGHLESLTLANPYLTRSVPNVFIPRDSIARMFYSANDARHPYDDYFKNYNAVYFANYFGATPTFIKFSTLQKGTSNFPIFGSCIPVFRWEDNILLMAESFYALGDFDNAIRYLNYIRQNRKVPGFGNSVVDPATGISYPPTGSGDNGGLLFNIFRERRIELAGECTRWYDQVRYNKLARNNPEFNNLIDKGGIYWPIDQEIIDKNPLIEQNAYWKK